MSHTRRDASFEFQHFIIMDDIPSLLTWLGFSNHIRPFGSDKMVISGFSCHRRTHADISQLNETELKRSVSMSMSMGGRRSSLTNCLTKTLLNRMICAQTYRVINMQSFTQY